MKCLFASVAAVAVSSCAFGDTVTLAPPSGTTTNVYALYTGDTAVEIAGPGTVRLNNANSHTGGTTLSGGTLAISGNIPAGSHSPVGAGTFTVSGGTILGSGTFGGDITGTAAFSIAAPNGWALSGNNSFAEPVTLADGTLEISGGSTAFGGNFNVCRTTAGSASFRISGGNVTFAVPFYLGGSEGTGGAESSLSFAMTGGTASLGANNMQIASQKDANTAVSISGGSFDGNGRKIVVGFVSGPANATLDVSGDGILRNLAEIYAHANAKAGSFSICVRDGGTLGAGSIYNNASGNGENLSILVDGGTLANDTTGSSARTGVNWIKDTVTSFKVGSQGATFTTGNGASAGLAQIRMPILAEAAGEGEIAQGVTFEAGDWGYYVAGNAYEGPTVIKGGAGLFLYSNGTIPSGSTVTVASGGELCVCGSANKPKTVSSLVLQDGAILGFGSSINPLTVSGSATLPSRAQIALYNNANPTTGKKNDNGSYSILKVPSAYAAALRAVRWSCATITEGKSATFAVTESGGTATLSMTIADSDAATTSGDISVGPGEFVSLDGSLNVQSRTVTVDGGYLKIGASLTETSGNGEVIVENGGLLDVYNYVRFSNDANSRYDLYVRDGGIVRALLFSPPSGVTVADLTNALHLDGGTLQFVAPRKSDYADNNRQNPYKISVLVGAGGATLDLSHWADRDRTGWFRFTAENMEFNHDPNCAGSDGGITVCGSNGDTILYYFKSIPSSSTMNGGITVADGGIISTVSGLANQTVRIQPGGQYRGYNANNAAGIENLVLGDANATKPVEIVVCQNSTIPTIVVTGSLSVRSPVAINVAQGWNYDASLVSGVYTALVYQAASPALDTSLFQLPAGASGTLSATTVALTEGTYAGYTALVVTIENDIVVTGATEYPTPLTVSSDRSCSSIVVGGAWNGVADPVANTELTVSGNVTASDGLYLGYNPAPGVDKDNWHQGFLTLNGGSITTPAVYSIYRPGAPDSDAECRFGCGATINNGILDVAGNVLLGYSRSKNGNNLYSCFTVNGGRIAVGGMFCLLYVNNSYNPYSAPGSIVLNGGEVDVKGVIDLTRNANKPAGNTAYSEMFGVWLNGGVLKAENIMMTANATSPKLVFNGGVYMPYGAKEANRTMQNLNVCYVSTNGAVISTENIPAGQTYTIAQALLTDPALNGATDGGLTKRGAGTLALTGANTFTGPLVVEEGAVVLGGNSATLARVSASGVIVGNITVTNALLVVGDTCLSVEGDLTIANRTSVDFGGETLPNEWRAVAAATGTINAPRSLRISNGGNWTRLDTKKEGGVLYVKPSLAGTMMFVR